MMPAEYILAAIPLNIMNAIIISTILIPIKITPQEDVIVSVSSPDSAEAAVEGAKPKKEPFFSFLSDSILAAGKLILIIIASVIAFVALVALIDNAMILIHKDFSLENILGVLMFPFAWLLGFDPAEAFNLGRFMGTKIITNEFVVMVQVKDVLGSYSPHFRAVLTVFLTSFANFSTVGMIIGCLKGLVNKEKNDAVSKSIGKMLFSGIFVSLLSAAFVGLFVW
jgi:nucleoside permease NupC